MIILDGSTLTPKNNGGMLGTGAYGGAVEVGADLAVAYGAIALYVGGSGEARFRHVMYLDLIGRPVPIEQVSKNFQLHRLPGCCSSWTTAVADMNRDGKPNLIAGPYWYPGPDFTVAGFVIPCRLQSVESVPPTLDREPGLRLHG